MTMLKYTNITINIFLKKQTANDNAQIHEYYNRCLSRGPEANENAKIYEYYNRYPFRRAV